MPIPFQASFNAGEISPSLYARVDLAKYQSGAKTIKNFICDVHGGASNRPGTKFVAEVKDSSKIHRLIPFQFSTTQSYALEFGDTTMRVYRNGGSVLEADVTITGATQADPVVITATGHGFLNGEWVVVSGVVGMTELNGKTFKVANKTANNFEITDVNDNDIDGTGFSAYVSGGITNRIYEIVSPYSSGDLVDLAFAQSADVMYITHPDYFPRKLSRTGHTAWTLETVPFVDGPYSPRVSGDEEITVTPADRVGNDIAIVASADLFVAGMVGSPFRVGYVNPNDAAEIVWGWGTIDQVTDAQNARLDITETFGFEHIINHDFDAGIGFWSNLSIAPSTFTYDAPGSKAVLTVGASGVSIMQQEITVTANETNVLLVDLAQVQGQVRVYIGSTSGTSDILGVQVEATPGVKTYVVTPIVETIFVTIDNNGSSSGDVSKINEVSFTRQDLSTNIWRQGAWTSANGYPRTVTFFEQRLFFAGTLSEPQTVWSSKTSDFENFGFTTPFIATDSLQYTMDSRQVNAIQWLTTAGVLVAGTSRAEWKMFSGLNSDAMTPSSIYAKEETFFGSSSPGLTPPTIGNSLLFVQRGSKAVRDLQFSLEVDRLAGRDLTILSSHLLEGFDITEWAYADLPDTVLWSIRDDGVLLGFTYLREQEVAAWHRHVTDGSYESVAVVSSVSTDETYFIVNRTVNGNTVRYVELLQERIADRDNHNYFFVDSGLTYSGGDATIISGLDHLEGKDVSVLANGEVVEGKTVSSGQITLDNAATLVHVGLPYTSDLETLNIETGDSRGGTQGRKKIVTEATIHFKDTRGAFVGSDENYLNEMPFSNEADGEQPPSLFTGKKSITFTDNYTKEKTVFIRQTAPLPISVLSIIPVVDNSGG